jgi:hypothetical protein
MKRRGPKSAPEKNMKRLPRRNSFPIGRVMLGAVAAVAVLAVIGSISDLRRYLRTRLM